MIKCQPADGAGMNASKKQAQQAVETYGNIIHGERNVHSALI
jgi:hypothetical protein